MTGESAAVSATKRKARRVRPICFNIIRMLSPQLRANIQQITTPSKIIVKAAGKDHSKDEGICLIVSILPSSLPSPR
jgi:hypothetical protein